MAKEKKDEKLVVKKKVTTKMDKKELDKNRQIHDVWDRYEFDEEEKKEFANQLAQKTIEKQRTEDEKKSVMASLKSRLDAITGSINELSDWIMSGYKYKTFRCYRHMDRKNQKKKFYDIETGVLLKTETMSKFDMQQTMDEAYEGEAPANAIEK